MRRPNPILLSSPASLLGVTVNGPAGEDAPNQRREARDAA